MSVHEDLLNNGENNCSFTEDEVDIMCSEDGDGAHIIYTTFVSGVFCGRMNTECKARRNEKWQTKS